MAEVAARYAHEPLMLKPGNRLHRLVSILFDTHYDDLTDDRIQQLEQLALSWRWMNADGERV
jgi:hypothetical protein